MSSDIRWAQSTERAVGQGGSFADVVNRPLRDLLLKNGLNPDAPQFNGLAGPVFNVMAFGNGATVGGGTQDDTATFQRCAAAVCAAAPTLGGAVMFIPPGSYTITDTININIHRVKVIGGGFGKFGAVINFLPTSAKTCFKFRHSNTALTLYQNGIQNVTGASAGNTQGKVFIDCWDVSEFSCDHCTTNQWNGNSGSTSTPSISWRLAGREMISGKDCSFYADRPMHITVNPNTPVACSLDQSNFHNMYLGCNGPRTEDIILVDPAVVMQHVSFSGYQSWVLGRHGFNWQSSSGITSYPISFSNIRREQSGCNPADGSRDGTTTTVAAAAYTINIVNANLRGIEFTNCQSDNLSNGFKVTAENVNFHNCYHNGGAGTTAWDISNSVSAVMLGCFWQAGSSIVATGMEEVFGLTPFNQLSLTNPRVVVYASTAETYKYINLYGARFSQISGVLTNGSTVAFPMNALNIGQGSALLSFWDTGGGSTNSGGGTFFFNHENTASGVKGVALTANCVTGGAGAGQFSVEVLAGGQYQLHNNTGSTVGYQLIRFW
jgi:hypothetical protein